MLSHFKLFFVPTLLLFFSVQTFALSPLELIHLRLKQRLGERSTPAIAPVIQPVEKKQSAEEKVNKIIAKIERHKLHTAAKNWQIDRIYCDKLSTKVNKKQCWQLLAKQQKKCKTQIFNHDAIIIDLKTQLLYGIKRCRLVVYSRVITGAYKTPTPAGDYKLLFQRSNHYMQPPQEKYLGFTKKYHIDRGWYYSRRGYAIHDANWRKGKYWGAKYRHYTGSHGCTNTPTVAMDIIWREFGKGTKVYNRNGLPIAWKQELQQKVSDRQPIDPRNSWYVGDY